MQGSSGPGNPAACRCAAEAEWRAWRKAQQSANSHLGQAAWLVSSGLPRRWACGEPPPLHLPCLQVDGARGDPGPGADAGGRRVQLWRRSARLVFETCRPWTAVVQLVGGLPTHQPGLLAGLAHPALCPIPTSQPHPTSPPPCRVDDLEPAVGRGAQPLPGVWGFGGWVVWWGADPACPAPNDGPRLLPAKYACPCCSPARSRSGATRAISCVPPCRLPTWCWRAAGWTCRHPRSCPRGRCWCTTSMWP